MSKLNMQKLAATCLFTVALTGAAHAADTTPSAPRISMETADYAAMLVEAQRLDSWYAGDDATRIMRGIKWQVSLQNQLLLDIHSDLRRVKADLQRLQGQ